LLQEVPLLLPQLPLPPSFSLLLPLLLLLQV
jgi:hypothetical protein